MLKKIVFTWFFLFFIHPFTILLAQECNDAIPATTALQDNNNGMVSDLKTGLIWKKCSEGQTWVSANNSCTGVVANYSWQFALQQAVMVNNSSTNTQNLEKIDWRVPNIKELTSIVERKCSDPSINLSVFPSTSTDGYWSSSQATSYQNGHGIWHVHFGMGNSEANNNMDYAIRLVRSKQ